MVTKRKVPIVLLTGFLGTGKTSNLKQWIKSPEFAGAMVVVNELGEVGLDHQLLAFASDAPLLLDSGCACCEASEDLLATLERLFFDRLHRKIAPFSWVLIETTGIADPVPIAEMLQRSDIVLDRYDLAGVVATFDARWGMEQVERYPEVRRQIESASVLVLTKADLASADQVRCAREMLSTLNECARVLISRTGDLPAREFLEALRISTTLRGGAARRRDEAHHHHHAVHSEGVSTAFLPLPREVRWPVLESEMSRSFAEDGGAILRLKGVVKLEGESTPQVIQASQVDGIERSPFQGTATEPVLGLTIITQGTPAAAIARALAARLEQASERALPFNVSDRPGAVSA